MAVAATPGQDSLWRKLANAEKSRVLAWSERNRSKIIGGALPGSTRKSTRVLYRVVVVVTKFVAVVRRSELAVMDDAEGGGGSE